MKNILFISLLFTLVSCSSPKATDLNSASLTQSALSTAAPTSDTVETIRTSAASTVISISSPIPTETSLPIANPACAGTNGNWNTTPDANTPSITFTIQDCRITLVYIVGLINGQWAIVSNYANEPIDGSEFNFPYSFTDQDRYNLSGTFTSPTSASIRLVIFKGFRFTVDQPSPLNDDLTIDAIANLGEE